MVSIKEALERLDSSRDDHWTVDGLPRIDVVSAAVGRAVSRREITDAAPLRTRKTARPEAGSRTVSLPLDAPVFQDSATLIASEPPAKLDVGTAPTGNPLPGTVVAFAAPAPEVNPALVEPMDDVVSMTRNEVMASIDLIDRACAEFDRQATILARRRDQIQARLMDLGTWSSDLERARAGLEKAGAAKRDNGLKAYQASQAFARGEKVRRAQQFLDAGTTPRDVMEQLSVKSPLDQALAARKRAVVAPQANPPQVA